ncbi:MAG: chromosomal replication initiator protein DnaA [Candidatus Moraniibacteriota bacterium]
MTNEELWKAALGQIELSLSKANFVTWFKNTSILSREEGRVVIGVPNGFAKEWLENKYNLYIIKALKSLAPDIQDIKCSIAPNSDQRTKPETFVKSMDGARPSLPTQSETAVPIGFSRKRIAEKLILTAPSGGIYRSNLNTRYTFENFIVAENNELARAACFAISQNLGHLYNPLFIYGGVGLGKTHLLQALGNEITAKHPEKRVKYITSERFTSELVESIKNQTVDQFKAAYEHIDLLIIDDVQFLSGREKTQNEFFHIFNALYQLNKQIVISSDRTPKAIPTLEERLRSRFEGGMIADISRPSLETRAAILESKAQEKGIAIDTPSIQFIAEHVKENVRELEGALARVCAYSEFQKIPIGLSLVQKALSDMLVQTKKSVKLDDIVKVVSDFYGVPVEEMVKKGRKKEVAHPRQVAMYLLRTELDTPFSTIGDFFGGRDHTTVLHAVDKVTKNRESTLRIREEIASLKEKLQVAPV